MLSDTDPNRPLKNTFRHVISRILEIIGIIALIFVFGIVGKVVINKVPVEMGGLKISSDKVETPSKDVPFLVTEVQQLKEQTRLLEARLVKLLGENEKQKKQLQSCKDRSS